MAEVFEAVMLICFGASWPVSVYKSSKAQSNKGKSLIFLFLIDLGYLTGIIAKILYRPSWVIAIYFCNVIFVTSDILLFFRNYGKEKIA